MVAVLPRTGKHELAVEFDVKDKDDLLECSTSLAQAWPMSEYLLALELTHLSLHALGKDLDGCLEALMLRLPSSLKDLSLRLWALGGTSTAAVFGSRLPAQLAALSLCGCDLTDQDLAQFVFPASMRYLNLEENRLCNILVAMLPAWLHVLMLKCNLQLSDGTVLWVTVLPTTLRTINIAGTPLGDKFVAELLQWTPTPRATAAPRSIFVNNAALSCKGKEERAAKFTVLDARVPFQ